MMVQVENGDFSRRDTKSIWLPLPPPLVPRSENFSGRDTKSMQLPLPPPLVPRSEKSCPWFNEAGHKTRTPVVDLVRYSFPPFFMVVRLISRNDMNLGDRYLSEAPPIYCSRYCSSTRNRRILSSCGPNRIGSGGEWSCSWSRYCASVAPDDSSRTTGGCG